MFPDMTGWTQEQFNRWYESVSDEERAAYDYAANLTGLNTQQGYSFGGAFSPELTPSQYDAASYFQVPPDVDAKGNIEPMDLSNTGQAINVQQDVYKLLSDPSSSLFAGPGGFDVGAFNPTGYEYGTAINTPGITKLSNMASGPVGVNQAVAQLIQQGTDPIAAVNQVLERIRVVDPNDPNLDPADAAVIAQLRQSLPPFTGTVTADDAATQIAGLDNVKDPTVKWARDNGIDIVGLYSTAQGLSKDLMADPFYSRYDPTTNSIAGLYQDENTGLYYDQPKKPIYGETAQWYIDNALPFPIEQYTDEKYIQNQAPYDRQTEDALYSLASEDYKNAGKQYQAEQGSITDMEKLYQRLLNEANQPVLTPYTPSDRPARTPGPDEINYTLDPLSGAPTAMTTKMSETLGGLPEAEKKGREEAKRRAAALNNVYVRDTASGPKASSGTFGNMLALFSDLSRGNAGQAVQNFTTGANRLNPKTIQGLKDRSSGRMDRAAQRFQDASKFTDQRAAYVRALSMATALRNAGRTPLQDTLQQRNLAQRATGVYG